MKSAVDNTALFLKKARAVKVKTYLSCFVLCFVSFVCKADVLGPYITGQETIGDGYGRVVCVMYNTEYGSGSLTISDEDGSEYTLVAHANGGAPYCYLLKNGTYTVKSIGAQCKLTSNWTLNVGSEFTVNGGQSGYIGITKSAPPATVYTYGPYFVNGSGDNTAHDDFSRVLMIGSQENGNVVLIPVSDSSVQVTLYVNYQMKNSDGNAVPYVYYVRQGKYKIKSFTSDALLLNGGKVNVGDTITIGDGSYMFSFTVY